MANNEIEKIEIDCLIEVVYRFSGYDFRNYSPSYLSRRVKNLCIKEKTETISCLQDKVLRDTACMERFLNAITIGVTDMFRDPNFFLTFRKKVVPYLRTYPFIHIWSTACCTGEEAYSLAILLSEEGLYDKCRIYATDINNMFLQKAIKSIYPASAIPRYNKNYIEAGGKGSLSDYYTESYGNILFHSSLKQNIVFAQYNLVTDASFNEFHIILCRNILIYFNKQLQDRVHNLIHESLIISGMLCLGKNESIVFSPYEKDYAVLSKTEKIYQKIGS
ncbi:MAG: protein-glutamate O-methyltransferase CheR [bacterium]